MESDRNLIISYALVVCPSPPFYSEAQMLTLNYYPGEAQMLALNYFELYPGEGLQQGNIKSAYLTAFMIIWTLLGGNQSLKFSLYILSSWNTIDTFLKHPWNAIENFLEIPLKIP